MLFTSTSRLTIAIFISEDFSQHRHKYIVGRYGTYFLIARCDIWFRITRWRKLPYRVTLAPQTHNVTWLWRREVHKCSQVRQRVCIRYVCIFYVVYAIYSLSYTFATISVYASKYTRRQCFLSIFVTRTAESTRYM